MAASDIERRWIGQFQENLSVIRKVAGWTTQQLADELGVARQTVSNLETGRSPMTKLQYLALRTVFSAEIARRKDRDLARIIKTLVDDPVERLIVEQTRPADRPDGPRSPAADAANGDGTGTARTAGGAKERPPLSTAMQALAVITGVLASGTAAGILTYLMFPDDGAARR